MNGSRNSTPSEELRARLNQNRIGSGLGVYSICSASRQVLEAGMIQAIEDNSILLIESTSNQVNQFGGYTGQRPADFARSVRAIAESMRFPEERIVLGGDHLGPQAWRDEPAATALAKARDLIREYVQAGFRKIHLDASMHCADDGGDRSRPLADELVSMRAAELCRAAEEAHGELPSGFPAPLYVIGTEVPAPGGGHTGSLPPEVTRPEDLERTLAIARQSFRARGLDPAWERVVAVVVQPGVEFGETGVHSYDSRKAQPLSAYLSRVESLVYEAHSTDYQSPEALRQMVRDHFAILKVGPRLTFAFREAVFDLAAIEEEWLGCRAGVRLSRVRETIDEAMLANPVYWQNHYHGDEQKLRLARKYSLSDRIRYYWPQVSVATSLELLFANLSAYPAPHTLLSQYLPDGAEAVRSGAIPNLPADLVRHRILEVNYHYAFACGMRRNPYGRTVNDHAQ